MNASLHTFVINLDRSPDRLRVMQERLARTGLHWERIAAVEGASLDPLACAEVDIPGYRRAHGKELNKAELGCYLSHIKALRRFLAGPWDYALVLEDDADFPPDFMSLMERLLQTSGGWDIVKLSCFHSGTPMSIGRLTDRYRLAVPLSRLMNSNSILFNRHAAEVLLARLLPMRIPYDHALERASSMGLRLRAVTPMPCPADSGLSSTIGDRQHLRRFKLRWYRRGPAMLFRTRAELQRAGLGLAQWLAAHVANRRQARGLPRIAGQTPMDVLLHDDGRQAYEQRAGFETQ